MSSSSDKLFDSWDPPPATHDGNILQWNHSNWHKIGEGRYVSMREVRESLYDCIGYWPLLDEKRGVPKLLDHRNFIKYCYYVHTREDLQAEEPPEDYIAMGFEHNEASRKAYRDEQVRKRYHGQYWRTGFWDLPDICLTEEQRRIKRARPDVKSNKNQEYIEAVKSCQPDRIHELFKAGTGDLCPNCFQNEGVPMNYRRGVVAHALGNLYNGDDTTESYSLKAKECLRLVCSIDGVDVNADTWYTPAKVGPPLMQAVKNYDTEAAQFLIDAGARLTFPDATVIDGQWCNVLRPFEYPKHYKTALIKCVSSIDDDTTDEEVSNMLKLLLKAGSKEDILVQTQLDPNDDESRLTASDILYVMEQGFGKSFPISMAVLEEAESLVASNVDEEYKPNLSSADLADGEWATITNLGVEMQKKISEYLDIYQFALLKRTSKPLSRWPKPPTPPIDYHLIRFCFSDGRYEAYFGFAKTVSDAIEAFRAENSDGRELTSFSYKFIKIGDMDNQPVIPLLQYRNTESMESCEADYLSQIHPDGKKHFGVEEAGEGLPKESSVKRLMSGDSSAWALDDAQSWYKGVSFDDRKLVGALTWLEKARPSKDINLRHLWHTQGTFYDGNQYGGEDVDMEEIWLNDEQANEGSFRFGNDFSWAVCKKNTYLWSA